jgi:flagellar basal body-associated protein FliL
MLCTKSREIIIIIIIIIIIVLPLSGSMMGVTTHPTDIYASRNKNQADRLWC